MPAQESIPPAANVLGTIGTVLWCIQLIPQIWYNYKNKSTEGLPAIMMLVWGFGLFYSFFIRSITGTNWMCSLSQLEFHSELMQ